MDQVFGGYGFCRDYPVERLARSCKVLSIVEGTNGIQSMDAVLRKILLNPGRYNYGVFRKNVLAAVDRAGPVVDARCAGLVAEGLEKMDEVISVLDGHLASSRMEDLLMLATPVQQAMFMLSLAWLHLWSLTLTCRREDGGSAFHKEKSLASRFYLMSEFPKYFGRVRAILNDGTG
jgi:hypothetical protein